MSLEVEAVRMFRVGDRIFEDEAEARAFRNAGGNKERLERFLMSRDWGRGEIARIRRYFSQFWLWEEEDAISQEISEQHPSPTAELPEPSEYEDSPDGKPADDIPFE